MDDMILNAISQSSSIVFFGGAGVSTESGIPDFRSEDGLYKAKREYGYMPEEILSHDFYMNKTNIFYDYYKNNLIYKNALPNDAHMALAKLEREGKVKGVITQNIDGLHQKAGSEIVYELHGSVYRNTCEKCGNKFDLDYILDDTNCNNFIPYCNTCGGRIKPDVVLYDEALNNNVFNSAIDLIRKCDTLIIGGTSLAVYPAAGLIDYFKGDRIVLINTTATAYDNKADIIIYDKIGNVMKY